MSSNLLSARVHQLRFEAVGVLGVELRPADSGAAFPPVEAGAHVDVHLPDGVVRSYSLSNMPGETHRYVLGVLHDAKSRGGSRFIHEQLRVGAVIGLTQPRNHFKLDESGEVSVLVAGGIGITPLLSMLRQLAAQRRKAHLIYCARSRAQAGFLDELTALASADISIALHFDDESGGPPDLVALLEPFVSDAAHFYACGPAPMLAAYEEACVALGQAHVHLERFAAPPSAQGDTQTPVTESREYVVELRRSKRTIVVKPGQTLLNAVLDAGMAANYSCCEGICGACETPVLEGDVEHLDSLLNDEERAASKTMMICVSRAKSDRVVLDM